MNEKTKKYVNLFSNIALIILAIIMPIMNVSSKLFEEIGTPLHMFSNLYHNGDSNDVILDGQMIYGLLLILPIFSFLFNINLSSPRMKTLLPTICIAINLGLVISIPANVFNYINISYSAINVSIKMTFGYYFYLGIYILLLIYNLVIIFKEYRLELFEQNKSKEQN